MAEKDKIVIGKPVEEGSKTHHCLRQTQTGIEAGTIRLTKEGEPIYGEAVWLSGEGPVYDVETGEAPCKASEPISKPTKVSTPAYRDGWERLWGKPVVGEA
jgi:hypothetical protein